MSGEKVRILAVLRLDFKVERKDLYHRLKRYIQLLEKIIDDPRVDHDLRIKAFNALSSLVARAEKVLSDAELDELEERIRKLEEEVEEGGLM